MGLGLKGFVSLKIVSFFWMILGFVLIIDCGCFCCCGCCVILGWGLCIVGCFLGNCICVVGCCLGSCICFGIVLGWFGSCMLVICCW